MARDNTLKSRICQVYSDDEYWLNIPINRFWGACVGVLAGKLTVAQVKAFFQMSVGEETDFDLLIARVNAYSNTGNTNPRDRAIEWIRTVLVFYEDGGIPTFITPDDVWNWLSTL